MKEKRILHSLLLCVILLITTMHVRPINSSTLAERELARKLIKLFLAAAVLSPPGLGLFPVPLPLPVPFGIETLKPPIYAPFGFPFLHGGGFGGGLGGYGIGGGGFGGGGGYAAAASEMNPTVIALPVVRPDSEAAANAITKIPVTLPKFNQYNQVDHHVASSYSNTNPNSFHSLPSFPRLAHSSNSINFSSYQPSSLFSVATPSSTTTTSTTTPSSTSNHQMFFPPYSSFGIPSVPYHFTQPTPNPIQILG